MNVLRTSRLRAERSHPARSRLEREIQQRAVLLQFQNSHPVPHAGNHVASLAWRKFAPPHLPVGLAGLSGPASFDSIIMAYAIGTAQLAPGSWWCFPRSLRSLPPT